MRGNRWILLGALGACCFVPALGNAAGPAHVLVTNAGRLSVERGARGLALAQLETIAANGRRRWIDAETTIPIWTVTVVDANREKTVLTAADGQATVSESSATRLVMEWAGIEPADLRVVATVTVKQADLEWECDVEVRKSGYALWDIVYPEIGPIAIEESVHSLVPYGWGVVHDDLLAYCHDRVYPSAAQAMPFVAISDGTAGLYLGVHDRAGHAMGFFVGGRPGEPLVSMGVRHDVEGMGSAARFRVPYAVVTTPYAGDWYEAGRLYRQAAKQTPWGSIPPLAQRPNMPRWLLDTDLWFIGPCHDEETASRIVAFAEHFAVPTSAHVYTWHEIPFDDHYPEYFPAKPGFKAAVEKVQRAGIAVMPYINGRLWDPSTVSWKEKNAAAACALNEKGEKYTEVYGSKVPLSPMCPRTGLWQDTVVGLVDRLVNDVGVRAVYIDQISAAAAKRCFSDRHGHPVGGGVYWVEGYRDLLAKCRQVLPAGVALTTEENADPWNDLLDAWLMVNTQARGGEIVPLYPVVYGGRAISFGFQYIQAGDLKWRFPFRLKMARAFVYGAQLGWVDGSILDPQHAAEAQFLKTLCAARHSARDALQFGELLPPIGLAGGGSVHWPATDENSDAQDTQPAVLGSAWLTPGGLRRMALVNVADDERTVTLTLDARHIGEGASAAKHITLQPVGEGPSIDLQPHEGGWRGAVTVVGGDARVFQVLHP